MKSWLSISVLLNILGLLGICGLVWWMGGVSSLWSRIKNRGLTAEYHMLKDQYAKLPPEQCDLLMLGNSLTYYGSWHSWLPGRKIANRGIPGDGIEGLIDRMSDYKGVEPKVVLVMIGINDLSFHPKEWLIARYPKLIKALLTYNSEVKIAVQSILPVNNNVSPTGLSNSDIDAVNAKIKAYCHAAELDYIDLASGCKNAEGALKTEWTGDGLHLNGLGYEYWAGELKKLLTAKGM